MASVSFLPKLFRWVFAVLAVVATIGVVCVTIVFLIDPHMPPGTHFGPLNINVGGQPGTIGLRASNGDSDFTFTAFKGTITLFVARAGGLIEVIKHYGFPVVLIDLVFFAALFDVLRRLFRNVGLGNSFTRETVSLVQIIGGSLIVYSIVSAFAENFFAHAVYGYLADHATVTVSGTRLHLPAPGSFRMPHGGGFPFGSPIFFSGLLVLALSEVFRQGLALKAEHDLTV
jgi:hypothetical protein